MIYIYDYGNNRRARVTATMVRVPEGIPPRVVLLRVYGASSTRVRSKRGPGPRGPGSGPARRLPFQAEACLRRASARQPISVGLCRWPQGKRTCFIDRRSPPPSITTKGTRPFWRNGPKSAAGHSHQEWSTRPAMLALDWILG